MQTLLEQIWLENKDYLRRLLIGLSRDIDLTDDLLHESYLHASKGISEYRGENSRAWLAQITKNVFLAHLRRKYVRSEEQLASEDIQANNVGVDSSHHLTRMEVREAIYNLDPTSKAALLMKHYAGFTYQEIALRQGCPVGTAKSRVNSAISKLRITLNAAMEGSEMKCLELKDTNILDFVYGLLPKTKENAVKKHLAECIKCRSRVDAIWFVLEELDAVENDFKATIILELKEDGAHTDYFFARFLNTSGEILETLNGKGDFADISHTMVNGIEAPVEMLESKPDQTMREYTISPPKPIQPGDSVDLLIIGKPIGGYGSKKLDNDVWRFGAGDSLTCSEDMVYVFAVRLPHDAKFIRAEPTPDEIRTNAAATILWRGLLPANQAFIFSLDYMLDDIKRPG